MVRLRRHVHRLSQCFPLSFFPPESLRDFFLDCTTLVGLTNRSEPRTFTIRISKFPGGQSQVNALYHPPTFSEGWASVKEQSHDWTTYRTRFVVKARQLTQPLHFTDPLGREHKGRKGDYLVESNGLRSITPRRVFEDIYVPLEGGIEIPAAPLRKAPISTAKRRPPAARRFAS